MSLSEKIYFFVFSLVGFVAILRWGNIVWRNPDKFRKTLFVDPGNFFIPFLWINRILLLVFGLVLLFIFLIMSLSLMGVLK